MMAKCYFPGCDLPAKTKEHIPPKSFFPNSKKINLMTVRSCKVHNNEKTKDDIYALAIICLNSMMDNKNDAFEIFETKVKPQLLHNNQALLKRIFKDKPDINKNTINYDIEIPRLNSFFDCLTHGIVYNKINKKIELNDYTLRHLYTNIIDLDQNNYSNFMKQFWNDFFPENGVLSECIEFKYENLKGYSMEIYSVRFLGMDFIKSFESDSFNNSITVIHKFFDYFEVVSTLTRNIPFNNIPIYKD